MRGQVVFTTRSNSEARIVRGILEANGMHVLVSSDMSHSVFPAGEIRLAVPSDDVQAARQLLDDHRRQSEPGLSPSIDVRPLETRIGYTFEDRGLLEHAMTHRSRAHEDVTGGVFDNESLEFLGDAVLGFIVADVLYRDYPELDEGFKSKLKAAVVSTATLARVATSLDLGAYLLLGRGEEKTGGRRKQALLANTCEALIAALYLDGGLDAARGFIARFLAPLLREARELANASGITGDFKSALQETLQARDKPAPEYRTVEEQGPDHEKVFVVDVLVEGLPLARADGRTKKDAEQQAAKLALDSLLNRSR
ncbi:MAG: ribonuclease III [Vicinamibacterales bacterium]